MQWWSSRKPVGASIQKTKSATMPINIISRCLLTRIADSDPTDVQKKLCDFLSIKLYRGVFWQSFFWWTYCYGSSKSIGKETGKMHLCLCVLLQSFPLGCHVDGVDWSKMMVINSQSTDSVSGPMEGLLIWMGTTHNKPWYLIFNFVSFQKLNFFCHQSIFKELPYNPEKSFLKADLLPVNDPPIHRPTLGD